MTDVISPETIDESGGPDHHLRLQVIYAIEAFDHPYSDFDIDGIVSVLSLGGYTNINQPPMEEFWRVVREHDKTRAGSAHGTLDRHVHDQPVSRGTSGYDR